MHRPPVRMSDETIAEVVNRSMGWTGHWAWPLFGEKIEPIEDEV